VNSAGQTTRTWFGRRPIQALPRPVSASGVKRKGQLRTTGGGTRVRHLLAETSHSAVAGPAIYVGKYLAEFDSPGSPNGILEGLLAFPTADVAGWALERAESG